MNRRLHAAAAAFVLCLAAPASAQFTTVVVPPPRPRDTTSQRVVAEARRETRDSAQRTQMSNIRVWVDSAAGALARGDSAGVTVAVTDSASGTIAATATTRPATAAARAAGSRDTTFREGGRAPDTATPLPLLAAAGVTLLGGGLVLARRRRA